MDGDSHLHSLPDPPRRIPVDPFPNVSTEQLRRDVALAYFDRHPRRTVSEILEASTKGHIAEMLDPSSPEAERFQREHGITPERHALVAKELTEDAIASDAAETPIALNELAAQGLLTYELGVYEITDAGRAVREGRLASGKAAAEAAGSTPESRSFVLSFVPAEGATLEEIVDLSEERQGLAIEGYWVEINLRDLVTRGQVEETESGRFVPVETIRGID